MRSFVPNWLQLRYYVLKLEILSILLRIIPLKGSHHKYIYNVVRTISSWQALTWNKWVRASNNIISELIDRVLDEDGEIIISSLLPRTDNMEKVKGMNNFLIKIPRCNRVVKFMGNNNIVERMLSPNDRKHLGIKGFRILLANIRFFFLGKCLEFLLIHDSMRKQILVERQRTVWYPWY